MPLLDRAPNTGEAPAQRLDPRQQLEGVERRRGKPERPRNVEVGGVGLHEGGSSGPDRVARAFPRVSKHFL